MRFCREMQKWRSLLVVALTAQLWSEGARAAGWLIVSLQASSSSPLSLSRWDFLTVNPENRRRADTEKTADIIDVPLLPLRTKSIIHCICLSPSPCVCLSLSLSFIFTPALTQTRADCPTLFRAVKDQQVFRRPVISFCLLESIWWWA